MRPRAHCLRPVWVVWIAAHAPAGQTLGATPVVQTEQTFTYNPFGDVATMSHVLVSSTNAFEYNYDARHQLIGANNNSGQYVGIYGYGDAGRLTHVDLTAPAGSPQAITRNVDYDYSQSADPECNVTARTGPDGTRTFAYDGEDQLRQVVDSATGSETYYYTHTGERMMAVRRDLGGNILEMRYFFAGTELTYNGGGTVDKTRATVTLGQPVARIDRSQAGPEVSYLYHSPLQHLLVAMDETGVLTAGFVYGPFGEILEELGTPANYPRRFNDKYFDDISSLSYYGARYYDPMSLSWTQADRKYHVAPDLALLEPRRANHYGFALQNPMVYVDPDGRDARKRVAALHAPTYAQRRAIAVALKDKSAGGRERALHLVAHAYGIDISQAKSLKSIPSVDENGNPVPYAAVTKDGNVGVTEATMDAPNQATTIGLAIRLQDELALFILHEMVHVDQQGDAKLRPSYDEGEKEAYGAQEKGALKLGYGLGSEVRKDIEQARRIGVDYAKQQDRWKNVTVQAPA